MGAEMGPLQGAAAAAATVAAAVAMHVGLRRLRCRLPLVLTRRRLGHPATHPDPALDRLIGVAVLPLTASVWLGAFRRHGVEMPFPQHDVRLRSPDLSAIALAFARRHLGDDALADARGMLATGAPAEDTSDLSTDAARPTWSDQDLDAIVARLRGP
jgi:hypothetical protein